MCSYDEALQSIYTSQPITFLAHAECNPLLELAANI